MALLPCKLDLLKSIIEGGRPELYVTMDILETMYRLIIFIIPILLLVRVLLEVRLRWHNLSKVGQRNTKRLMVVLGSGGHTAEMIKLLGVMKTQDIYRPRCYVVADTDVMGQGKAERLEMDKHGPLKGEGHDDPDGYTVMKIPRSREVGQSFVSSIFPTLRSGLVALRCVCGWKPDLLLVNGPGTCLPVCVSAKVAGWLGLIPRCKIVYIESIARVEHLSLTGKILYRTRLADHFLVQWQKLMRTHPRAKYVGRLM